MGTTLPTGYFYFTLDDFTMIAMNNIIGTSAGVLASGDHVGVLKQAPSTQYIHCYGDDGLGRWHSTAPVTWAAGNRIEHIFSVKISGWESECAISSSTMNRDIAIDYTNNGGESITVLATDIPFSTKITDTTNAWNGTEFDPSEDGRYHVMGCVHYTAALLRLHGIYIDGVATRRLNTYTNQNFHYFNGKIDLKAREKLSIRAVNNGGTLVNTAASHWISITKDNSGTEKIATAEKVIAVYEDAITTIATATVTNINYTTKVDDTHNAVTTGAGVWKFTSPRDDCYEVKGALLFEAKTGWQLLERREFAVCKNSYTTPTHYLDYYVFPTSDAAGNTFYAPMMKGSTIVHLKKGETISFAAYQDNDNSINCLSSTIINRVSVVSRG